MNLEQGIKKVTSKRNDFINLHSTILSNKVEIGVHCPRQSGSVFKIFNCTAQRRKCFVHGGYMLGTRQVYVG